MVYKVPLRDVVDLKSGGCRKLKRGNTGVPVYMSVARFAGVVPLLLLLYLCCPARMLLKFRASAGRNCLSRCSGWQAHIIHTRTHAHRSTVRSCHEAKTLKYGHCYTVAATTSKAYGVTAAAGKRKKQRKLNGTSVLETVPGSYCCRILKYHTHTHAHSRTHTQKHRSWLSQTEKLEARQLSRGCLAFGN